MRASGPPRHIENLTKMCERKINYRNRRVAQYVAALCTKRAGKKIEAYKCPLHRHWHIGHAR